MFSTKETRNQVRALIHVTMLHNLSKSFHFGMCLHDSLLHNYIVVGVRENQAHKRMLQHTTLILRQCVNISCSCEATSTQLTAMEDLVETEQTNKSRIKITNRNSIKRVK